MDAMLSQVGPVFYGDIRSHERVRFSLVLFLGSLENDDDDDDDDDGV